MLAASLLLFLAPGAAAPAAPATYYVANAGSDAQDGRSPERAWRTIARVCAETLHSGDRVLFRRGDTWREPLVVCSGDETGVVTYGAYGAGPKPVLMGSVSKSRPADWKNERGNIWSAGEQPAAAGEDAPLPPPTVGLPAWQLYAEGGASARVSADQGSCRVECAAPGQAGNHIQLSLMPFRIERGKAYRLAFRARCTRSFALRMPSLMQAGPPWTGYSAAPAPARRRVEPEWHAFSQFYRANATATDARLTLYLGGVLPAGAALDIERVSFAECNPDEVRLTDDGGLPVDVGNIIFDGGKSCGVKVWKPADLKAQDQYWYDEERQLVKVYSIGNPAERHASIECALRRHIIDESGARYVTFENLHLTCGGAHGIGGGSTHHITVRDCDISWIGGGSQYGGTRTVRFGNGIEFWGSAHDNLVERCRLWEIYDAALTNQNGGADAKEYNITYRLNQIWNSEYSFEYWNRPETSETWNIRFENNTCFNAGGGWGHAQRPDPSGRHLCFYDSPAKARDIFVRNNIFCGATGNAFYAPGWPAAGLAALTMDHNCWYQPAGDMIHLKGKSYSMAQFAAYQAEQGKDAHSLAADALFAAPAKQDFHLQPASPCLNAGMDVGLKADFEGTPVPQGPAPDIGALERRL